jgi:hypothetical protein
LEKVSRYIDDQEKHHRAGRLSVLLETVDAVEDDWEAVYLAKADEKPPEGG